MTDTFPARALAALLLTAPLLTTPPAHAQHWNDTGPGKDLLSSTISDLEAFRQRSRQAAPTAQPGTVPNQARAPIPILDWMPPPPAPQPPRPALRRTVRRTPPPESAPPADPVPQPASAPRNGSTDWERSFQERERELERLRRLLDEDRARYDRSRQP